MLEKKTDDIITSGDYVATFVTVRIITDEKFSTSEKVMNARETGEIDDVCVSISEFNDKASLFALIMNRLNTRLQSSAVPLCLIQEEMELGIDVNPGPHPDTQYLATYLLELALPKKLVEGLKKPNNRHYVNTVSLKNTTLNLLQFQRFILAHKALELAVKVYRNKPASIIEPKEVAVYEENGQWYYQLANKESKPLDFSRVRTEEDDKSELDELRRLITIRKDIGSNQEWSLIFNPEKKFSGKDMAIKILQIVSLDGFLGADFGVDYHFSEEIYHLLPLINSAIPVLQGANQEASFLSILPDGLLYFILNLSFGKTVLSDKVIQHLYTLIKDVYNDRDHKPDVAPEPIQAVPGQAFSCSKNVSNTMVFLKFMDRQVARDFIEEHPGIPKLWDKVMGQHLKKLDAFTVSNACVVRIPIQSQEKPYYENFRTQYPELYLPSLEEIPVEKEAHKVRQFIDPRLKLIDKLESYIYDKLDEDSEKNTLAIIVAKKLLDFRENGGALILDEEELAELKENAPLSKIIETDMQCQQYLNELWDERSKQIKNSPCGCRIQ